eukprot:2313617-Amphidinium_carterae.1
MFEESSAEQKRKSVYIHLLWANELSCVQGLADDEYQSTMIGKSALQRTKFDKSGFGTSKW